MSITHPSVLTIPPRAGVYLFMRGKTPLYIGKAINLRKRLASYFRRNTGGTIQSLLRETTNVRWEETGSETEALLREAELIKDHVPKYNVFMRDDKNYFYVGFTKEKFPRICITHQPESIKNASYIGPFTSGVALKAALRALRASFPYCVCKKAHKRQCLNASIGRCPGYCCLQKTAFDTKDAQSYQENIKQIIAILSGRRRGLLRELKHAMQNAAEVEDFERAARLRNKIYGIENIFGHGKKLFYREHSLRSGSSWRKIKRTLHSLFKTRKDFARVEGYDVSNISGTHATGSMVVFIEGEPSKSDYRTFKIKTVSGANDVAMLKEVIQRRLNHPEWPYPDLMLIDGGRQQLNGAVSVMGKRGRGILIAGLAKREEELYLKEQGLAIPLLTLPNHTAFFLQRVRDESHRFAKKYHHILRKKVFGK